MTPCVCMRGPYRKKTAVRRRLMKILVSINLSGAEGSVRNTYARKKHWVNLRSTSVVPNPMCESQDTIQGVYHLASHTPLPM